MGRAIFSLSVHFNFLLLRGMQICFSYNQTYNQTFCDWLHHIFHSIPRWSNVWPHDLDRGILSISPFVGITMSCRNYLRNAQGYYSTITLKDQHNNGASWTDPLDYQFSFRGKHATTE